MEKVLHLLMSNSLAGAERVAIDIIKMLERSFDLYYCSPSGPIQKTLKQKNIKYIEIKSKSVLEILRIITKLNPDIIHAHDYRASVMSSFIKSITNRKYKIISHLHNNNPWAKKVNLKTLAFLISSKKIDKLIVVSKPVINEFVFNKKLCTKTIVLPNCIDIDYIERLSKEKATDKSDFIFIGRFVEQKNPLAFINIIKKIKRVKSDVKAIMLGDGVLKDVCVQTIQKNNLSQNIKLLGFQQNPYPYLLTSDILISTSKWEGFGLVLLEAMALSKPVISLKSGGPNDIIINGQNGYLCDDYDQMEEKCIELFVNNDLREKMGRNAYILLKKKYNKYNYKYKITEIYNNLLWEEER